MNIAEAIYTPTDQFDITTYITPGVEYDQLALKAAYRDACNAGMGCKEDDLHFREGTRFRLAVYQWLASGWLTMPMSVTDRHGEKTDFFNAVIDMHPADHPHFKTIDGYLYLEYVPEAGFTPLANGDLPW